MKVREGYKMTELGEIPNDWEINNAGSLFETVAIKNSPDEKVLTVTQDRGTIYRYDCGINIKTMDDSLKNFKLVQQGNFIISLRSFQGGIEYSTLRGIVSPAYTILTNTKPIYDGFYKYFFKSDKFITLLDSAVIGIRDGKQISYEVFKNLKLPYPPLPEQQRIAEILSSNDALITKTDELIEKTKEVKQGLMQELLTKGIGHTEFKDSELGRIPKDWEVKNINDIAVFVGSGVTPKGGQVVYKAFGIPFIRSQNVYSDGLRLDDVAYIDEEQNSKMKRTEFKEDDILLNITGASIGRCTFVPVGFGIGNVNQHVCIIRANSSINFKFLSLYISSPKGQEQIKAMNNGSSREGLNFQQVRSIKIPMIPKKEQEEISQILISLNHKHNALEKQKQQLEEIKQGLMQDLLTGRVRVKNVI